MSENAPASAPEPSGAARTPLEEFESWWRETGGDRRGPGRAERPSAPGPNGRSAGGSARRGVGAGSTAPPGPLDRPTTRKLVRRRLPLDGRIDLHGLTEAEAHDRLAAYLREARADGLRHVIVITGKGSSGSSGDGTWDGTEAPGRPRGVLRRAVPQWFRTAPFRDLVSGHSPAARRDGGDGALYVKLRRQRG